MADYKVNTAQLAVCAGDIRSVRTQMNSVAVLLSGLQLGSVLRIQASTALIGRVTDCKWAVINQADNLSDLSNAMDTIAQIYERCEKNLMEPKTQAQADAQAAQAQQDKIWDDVVDAFGEMNFLPFSLFSMIVNFHDGGGTNIVDGLKGLAGIISQCGNAVKFGGDGISVDWMKMFGLADETGDFFTFLKKEFTDYIPSGSNNVSAFAKWGGAILTAIGSGVQNYEEFNGDLGNARFWQETIMQTVVDLGTGVVVSAGVAAALVAVVGSAPALAVGAIGAGITLLVNWGVEAVTGKNLTELVSDAILDFGDRAADAICEAGDAIVEGVRNVGEAISEGASAAWNGICNIFS